jgi:HK97 family phage prohead protease
VLPADGRSTLASTVKGTATMPQREGKRPFYVDLPFAKTVGSKGDLVLHGYGSTWVQDRDGEYVLPTAFDKTLPTYLAKNPILLWQHNFDTPLGQVTKAEVDNMGLEVEAVVRRPVAGEEPWKHSAYEDIKAGIVRTFSIGGWFTRDMLGGQPVIVEVELWELSVVSVPSNPDSIFEAAVKSLNGENRPALTQKAVDQMQQLLGLHTVSDPELYRMDAGQRRARYDDLVLLYRRAGKHAPAWDSWRTVAQQVMAADAGTAVDPAVAQATIEVVRQARGLVPVDGKAGRVLSKSNEQKLQKAADAARDAYETIGTVLDLVRAADDPAPDDSGLDTITPLV